MRKSCISLVLSGVLVSLCAESASTPTDTIIANFGNKDSEGKGGTWDSVKRPNGEGNAEYGKDWSGSDTTLGVNTNDLTFSFGNGGNSAGGAGIATNSYTKLLFKDGFAFYNNTSNSAKVTIQWSQTPPNTSSTLIFGGDNNDAYSKILIQKDLAVHLKDFQNVEVKGRLLLSEKSSLILEGSSTLKNQSGIILQKEAKIQAQNLQNDGVIALNEGSSLVVGSIDGVKKGKLDVQGNAQIEFMNSVGQQNGNKTIQNQIFNVWSGKILEIGSSSTSSNSTLVLGEASKSVDMIGGGEIMLNGFASLESKNLSLSNATLKTGSATTLTNTNLALNGGYIFLGEISKSGNAILSSDTNGSTFNLTGTNNLITAGNQDLQIQGTHTFKSGGTLDILGKNIILGDLITTPSEPPATNSILTLKGENGSVLALGAQESIKIENLKLENLTLQALGDEKANIANKTIELGVGSIIEAVNRENQLIDLVITKNENTGVITVANGATSTLKGKNITITDNTLTLNNATDTKTALILEALEGSVNLRGSEDTSAFKIEGKNTLANNVIDFHTSRVHFGKSIELDKLSIIAGSENGVTFYGTQGGSVEFKNGSTISTGRANGDFTFYKELTFASQFSENQGERVKLKFNGETTLKGSGITLQNQEVTLNKTNGADSNLNLYAYGNSGVKDGEDVIGTGTFSFINTIFTQGSSNSGMLKLYGGVSGKVGDENVEGGVALLANNLTLDSVSLQALKIKNGGVEEKNSLDLSASNGVLTALGSVNIEANGIYTSRITKGDDGVEKNERVQGIGMDIYVGDSTKIGTLTIKSDIKAEEFVIGGNLILDHSKATSNSGSTLAIELGKTGDMVKLDDQTLGLDITGGIKAIHNDQFKETEIKAKNFKFGEISTLHSINGTLKLNTKEDSEIEIKGKVILEGTDTAEAKLEVIKNGTPPNDVKLKLHNIESKGKASITNQGITFVDSHISASANGDAKSLVITDNTIPAQTILPPTTSPSTPIYQMDGTIASITLDGAELEFKRGSGSGSGTVTAGIHLNANGVIKSSGDSKLTTKTIKVGKEETDRYSLDVSSGTLTLIEESTENKIGDIALDGGHFVFKSNGSQPDTYHSLKLQGNLTSKGNSSISISSLEIAQKETEENKNYSISSASGELRFNLMGGQSQEFKNDFVLNDGGIGFYDANSQAMGKISFKESTITSSGNSFIKASEIDLGGASISATSGTLQIFGVKTNTLAGNLSVGNAGVIEVKNHIGSNATLRIQKGSTVSLKAVAPYISPSEPLGGGQFGKVVARSLIFEGDSGESKLINVAVSNSEGSNAQNLKNDSLFALREGEVVLIDTDDGIFKKSNNVQTNITLEDVSVDKGGYTSITLTPEFVKSKDWLGQDIVQKLVLNISVSQTTSAELMESIKDPQNKQIMEQIFSNSLNGLIVDSILQSSDNVFKVGMAEYIASGNVEIVDSTLRYITMAFQGVSEGIYASDKIQRELKMLRTSSLENRMVRSGNPYVSKVEIASLLKAVSGTRYASEDDGILLDGEYSGPNYGSLWASYEGATSFGTLENASVNGLSAGYDTLMGDLKEYLLGFYVNYGYGTYGSQFVKNDSHNFGLGFYSRMTFKNNEVDLIISQSIGLNQSDLNLGASDALSVQYLNQNLKYNFYLTDAQIRYGYLIAVGSEESPFYFKPFGGVDFGFSINGEARGEGVASIGIDQAMHFKLDVVLGLEMKKYFNEGSYIYLMPVLEKGLFNDGNVVNLGFVGANKIPFGQNYQVDTAVGLYAGGQGSVADNVSITGGLGIKMDIEKKDVLTNWNVGFKYKF